MVNLGKTIANHGRVEMSLTLKNCNVLESIISYSFLIGSVVRALIIYWWTVTGAIWKPIKKIRERKYVLDLGPTSK